MKARFPITVSAGGGPSPLSVRQTARAPLPGLLRAPCPLRVTWRDQRLSVSTAARKRRRKRARPEQTLMLRETSPSLAWISEAPPPPNLSLALASNSCWPRSAHPLHRGPFSAALRKWWGPIAPLSLLFSFDLALKALVYCLLTPENSPGLPSPGPSRVAIPCTAQTLLAAWPREPGHPLAQVWSAVPRWRDVCPTSSTECAGLRGWGCLEHFCETRTQVGVYPRSQAGGDLAPTVCTQA